MENKAHNQPAPIGRQLMNQPASTLPAYMPRLEALRGVAALMVAYTHAIGGIQIDSALSQQIKSGLNIIGNGSAAVTLFFVLSGFVLATSLDNKDSANGRVMLHFLTRRLLRIWPAMLFALLCCFLWITFVFEPIFSNLASPGYTRTWSRPAEPLDLALDALFVQNFLDPVTWTLQVEMVGAVLFVPLWWCCRRSFPASLVLLAAWLAYFLLTPLYVYARSGFVLMFIMGIQARHGIRLISALPAPHWPTTIFTTAFIGCCLVTKWVPETRQMCWVYEAIAAYWAISALAASRPEKRIWILDNRVIRVLGRISYSFYLWHFPIVFILGGYCFSRLSTHWLAEWPNLTGSLVFAISTLLTIPIAWLSYRFIECPGMSLARSIILQKPVNTKKH